MELVKSMIKYDTDGDYIRADKIARVRNRVGGYGVVIISEDGEELGGNMTAEQVIDQMSFVIGGGT